MEGITGIIAEYNPFHKGHGYQIEKIRELTADRYVLVIMSGDFVQRGAPAIFDKYARTRMALLGGADAVLELPSCWACGSAEYFARGAVGILDALACVDHLCFGSESGDAAACQKLGRVLAREPEEFQNFLRSFLKEGLSFPAARKKALTVYLENHPSENVRSQINIPEMLNLLDSPNNLLGIEYCKALSRLNSQIAPVTLKREGAGYHEKEISRSMPSATALRRALIGAEGKNFSLSRLLSHTQPDSVAAFTEELLSSQRPVTEEDFSLLLKYQLLLRSPEELAHFADVSLDLARRIGREQNRFVSFSQFASLLKTREMTYTRISRVLLHILLEIAQEDLAGTPGYVRLLGFRKESSPLLRRLQDNSRIPVITKAADYRKLIPENQWRGFEKDLFCADLYESVKTEKSQKPFVSDLQKAPVIL